MNKLSRFTLLAAALVGLAAPAAQCQTVGAANGGSGPGNQSHSSAYAKMNEQSPSSWAWYDESSNNNPITGAPIYNPNWGGQAAPGQTLGGQNQHSHSNGYFQQLQSGSAWRNPGTLEVQTGLMAPNSVSPKGFQDGYNLGFHGSALITPYNGSYSPTAGGQASFPTFPVLPAVGTGSVNVNIGSGY